MPAEIVTTDDLREFKVELFREFKKMLQEQHGHPARKWLKSYEIRKLLGISPGTLQNLRVNGTLPFTLARIGDCEAPAIIAAATYAGHRYAQDLDRAVDIDLPMQHEKIDVGAELPREWRAAAE